MSHKQDFIDQDKSGEDKVPTIAATGDPSKIPSTELNNGKANGDSQSDRIGENDEEKPLISKPHPSEHSELKYPTDSFKSVLVPFFKAAFPCMMALLMERATFLISVIFLSNIDTKANAGMGLGESGFRGLGVAFVYGSACAYDTLASQAYGAQNYSMVHVWHQRAIVILIIYSIPSIIIYAFYAQIMELLGVEEELAVYARNYAVVLIPGLFFIIYFETTRRYLQCLGYFWPSAASNAITLPLHVIWCYIFVYVLDLLEIGVGIAMSMTWLINLMVILFIKKKWRMDEGIKQPWSLTGFCSHVWIFSELALSGGFSYMLDILSAYVTVYEASIMGSDENSAQVIVLSVVVAFATSGYGISIATTEIVGYFIGKRDVAGAKLYAYASIFWSLSFGCLFAIVFNIFNKYIILIFTRDSDVAELAETALHFASITAIGDLVYLTSLGITRGLGMQKENAVISAVCSVIGVAIGYALAFHTGLGLNGLWLGWFASTVLAVICLSVMLKLVEWVPLEITDKTQ